MLTNEVVNFEQPAQGCFLHLRKTKVQISLTTGKADEPLSFMLPIYLCSLISSFHIQNSKHLSSFCIYTAQFMSDLIRKSEDRFSTNNAHSSNDGLVTKLSDFKAAEKPISFISKNSLIFC